MTLSEDLIKKIKENQPDFNKHILDNPNTSDQDIGFLSENLPQESLINHISITNHELAEKSYQTILNAGVIKGPLAAVSVSIQEPIVATRLASIIHGHAGAMPVPLQVTEAMNTLRTAMAIPANIPNILAAIVHAEANAAAPIAGILRAELNRVLTAQPAAAPALIAELVRIGLAGTPEAAEANRNLTVLIELGDASLNPLIAVLGAAGVSERNLLIRQMAQTLRVAGRGQLALDLAEKIRTIGGASAAHIAQALEVAVTVNRVALENLLEGISIAGLLGALADADELKNRITAVCVAAGGEAVIKELAEIITHPVAQLIEAVASEVLDRGILRTPGGVNNVLSAISACPHPLGGVEAEYADELNRLLITDMGFLGGEATATALATVASGGIPGAAHVPIASAALELALRLGGASTQNVLTALGAFAAGLPEIGVIKNRIAAVLRTAGREAFTDELAAAVVAGHAATAHITDVIESECVRTIPLSNILEVIRNPATPAANAIELGNSLAQVMQGPNGPAFAIKLAETVGAIGSIADTKIGGAIRAGGATLEAVMQAIEIAPAPPVATRLRNLVAAELSAATGHILIQRLAVIAATAAPGVVAPRAAAARAALITAGAGGNLQAQAAVHALPGAQGIAALAAEGVVAPPPPAPIVHAFHAAVAPPVAVAADVAAPAVVPPVAVGPVAAPAKVWGRTTHRKV